jgi:hypothetical protein
MVNPEEMEARKKEDEMNAGGSGDNSLITKSEMRCMIEELMGMGLIGSRVSTCPSELKLELVSNDVKLEGSKNYLSWSRRVRVLLGGKQVEYYLEEDCVEPVNKLSTEWKMWHAINSTIMAWLLASMSASVSKIVEAMRPTSQIWKTLSNIYSKKEM